MKSATWQGDWPVSQPWGCTDLTLEPWWPARDCHWHCGIDVAMPSGTALYAARSGLVTHRTLGILGIAVEGKEVDYYIHGAYPVLLGAVVKAGQRIGLSGNVMPGGGHTTGPHLHFEVQAPGGYLNEPSTSLDPVPILFPGYYTGDGGTITADMTPEEHQWLLDNHWKVDAIWQATIPEIADLKAQLAALLAAIKAIPPGSAPTDNTAVLAAIANVQAIVDKIDRGD